MSALRRSASRQRLRRWHQRAGGVPPERVTAHSEVTPVRSRPVGSNRLGGSVSCIVTPKPKVKFKFSAVLAAMAALRGSAPGWCTMRRVPRWRAIHRPRRRRPHPPMARVRAVQAMPGPRSTHCSRSQILNRTSDPKPQLACWQTRRWDSML